LGIIVIFAFINLRLLFLGSVKSIIERWLGSDCTRLQWYSRLSAQEKQPIKCNVLNANQINELDRRLSSIKFPENVLRAMPQFTTTKGLKSIEYEIVLFFG
jgi:hypothetical protein